jgi:FkbM family methyltransferase
MGAAGHKVEDNSTAVVENYWDLKDFVVGKIPKTVQAATKGQPYYLYIGRIIPDKGWGIAVDATRDIGARLIMAGQGDPGEIRDSDHVTFFGAANVAERAALMSGAIATFCPTHFREPFGGTAVETQLCGTPAITTDHGAFTQTVEEKWRCANHREFVAAARRAQTLDRIDRHLIKQEAEGRYSLEAIAPKFERYFQRLIDLWGEGWYAKEPYKLSTEETESKCQARPEVKSRARLPSNFHLPDPPGEPYESSRHMAQHIFDGEYDPRVRMKWDTLHKSARLPSDVKRVIDIGSNMGAFAVWARAKWKNARVECFEPNPAAADFCERNAPFAKIHRSAVTVESTATLWIDETWGASRTFESKLAAGGNRIDVPVVHPKNLSPTDVLKIDAEGVEPEIIKHYPHLAGLKMCVYEYHRAAHRDELYGLCERAGLRCVRRIVYSTDIGVDIWIGSKPSGKKRRKR